MRDTNCSGDALAQAARYPASIARHALVIVWASIRARALPVTRGARASRAARSLDVRACRSRAVAGMRGGTACRRPAEIASKHAESLVGVRDVRSQTRERPVRVLQNVRTERDATERAPAERRARRRRGQPPFSKL